MNALEYIEDHGLLFFFFNHLVILCLLIEECGHYLSTTVTKCLVQVIYELNRCLYDLRVLGNQSVILA